ncbi:MAG TPA: caspase family protein [Candidatus Angelobacter sp.]|nr:caspase family protein [Candidatus Angelobacter sp.]
MNRKYALVIGNKRYDDRHLRGLKAPEYDVKALAQLLRDPHIGGFKVETLLNPIYSAARSAISRFLGSLAFNSDDVALMYFSGHGVKKDGHVYLAVRDTEYEDPRALGLDTEFLRETMQNCYASKKILILDCCYSGAFAKMRAKGPRERQVDTRSAFIADGNSGGKGQIILTATDSLTIATEADQAIKNSRYSLFTHYLIEGLRDGSADGANDSPPDGLINDEELYRYAYQNVTSTKSQKPQRLFEGEGKPIVIAKNPFFHQSLAQHDQNPSVSEPVRSPPRRRRSHAEPQLMAEFDLTSKGTPRSVKGSYSIRIFIKNAPRDIRKVVYKLDDPSFDEPVFTVEEGADDFEEYISSWGDVKIIATLHGRKKRKLVRWLSRALERHYRHDTTEAIEDALEEIVDN